MYKEHYTKMMALPPAKRQIIADLPVMQSYRALGSPRGCIPRGSHHAVPTSMIFESHFAIQSLLLRHQSIEKRNPLETSQDYAPAVHLVVLSQLNTPLLNPYPTSRVKNYLTFVSNF